VAKHKMSSASVALGQSVGARSIGILCMDPEPIKNLTGEQLAALHVCKHEILASIFRLYMVVDPKIADDLIGDYIKPPRGGK
jgi:hypothetical protein